MRTQINVAELKKKKREIKKKKKKERRKAPAAAFQTQRSQTSQNLTFLRH